MMPPNALVMPTSCCRGRLVALEQALLQYDDSDMKLQGTSSDDGGTKFLRRHLLRFCACTRMRWRERVMMMTPHT